MITSLLLAVPLSAALVSGLMSRSRQYVIEYVAITAAFLQLALGLILTWDVLKEGTVRASIFFETDALGAFIVLFTTIVGLATAMHSIGHLREEMRKGDVGFSRIRQYFVLAHLFFFAMLVAAMTASPLIMWVAIEATTLATACLITFYNKPSALEAGWKHLMVNSVGLLLGFLGTLLFLNAAASAGANEAFLSWSALQNMASTLDPLLVKIAFIFVLVGFGTKVGFVPMHTWLPDAHSKAPVPISSLLSGVLLNVALIAILRFKSVTDSVVDQSFTSHLLIGFGILSLVLASLMILGQKNYKRMLAYSSIENMGIMALGFGIGGVAVSVALLHMLYHSLLKATLFLSAGNFFLKYGSTKIAAVRGALNTLPVSSVVFLGALLAVAGVPISGIFFTKLSILTAGIQDYPYIVILALAALAIVFAGFIRHAGHMLFGSTPQNIPKGEANSRTLVSLAFLATLFIIFSVWIPESLETLIMQAAAIIQ